MFLRALIAFLTLPGVVALVVPPILGANDPWSRGSKPEGLVVLVVGLALLLWCVRDFYVSGKGTLAPWNPPTRLVLVGLYRYVRNPMYLGALVLVVGWAIYFLSPLVLAYAFIIAVGFHLRVVKKEEPRLESSFGEEWHHYSAAVGRWVPRLTPWRGAD